MRTLLVCSALLPFLSLPLSAQQPNPYITGAVVSGHVLCADTNAPARFARIVLKAAAPSHAGEDMLKGMTDSIQKAAAKSGDSSSVPPMTPERKSTMSAASRSLNQVMEMLGATTIGMDGAFSFSNVKPGTYYVRVLAAGYMDPVGALTDDDLTSTDPAVRARVATLPTITIAGTESARIDVRIERGAALSGRILFDDGTPAAGWTVQVIPPGSKDDPAELASAAMAPALAMSGGATLFKTDDLGHYRISGLPSGAYALRASLIATAVGINTSNIADGGTGIMLAAYSGDTFTRADAKSVKLIAGDEVTGFDLTIPARHLHTILGHVTAVTDGHALNGGQVSLSAKDDPTLHRTAAIRDDGSFRFEDLPSATYTLRIDDAADVRHTPGKATMFGIGMDNTQELRRYASGSANVVLADSDDTATQFSLAQTDWKPAPPKPGNSSGVTPGGLIDQMLGAGASDSTDTPK